ncbi:MAG: hypothetical protein IT195_07615 [Microthrixaceae bacterium]|nr:hypothetical protein [Microthrixaceae bacterium]
MAAIAELRTLVQPTTLAHERVLPVLPPLDAVLPHDGLALGSTIRVDECTSLSLALVAAASQAGSWVAAVGTADIGWAAAADLGLDLGRVLVVPRVGSAEWAGVVAALVDSVSVVMVRPGRPVGERDARRLSARARERGTVLLLDAAARSWPIEPDVVIEAVGSWSGLGEGHGRLRERRLDVSISGRRAAARRRSVELWLPAADGTMRPTSPMSQPFPLGPAG